MAVFKAILSYVQFCTDAVSAIKAIRVFPNQKLWLETTVHPLLKARYDTYRSGDGLVYGRAQAELNKGVQQINLWYRVKEHFNNNFA